jgi:cobalt-zinc-cadmium efflux system membrane fusion protein
VWRPGTFVTASVQDATSAPVVVPRAAVQRVDGESVVFAVDGQRFVPRIVTLGRAGRTRLEITAGLAPGDRYAETGSFLVKAEVGKHDAGHDH